MCTSTGIFVSIDKIYNIIPAVLAQYLFPTYNGCFSSELQEGTEHRDESGEAAVLSVSSHHAAQTDRMPVGEHCRSREQSRTTVPSLKYLCMQEQD